MKKHSVIQGEDISSIAYDHGFLPNTIWEHSSNKNLREKRKNPNILKEGDTVIIPDIKTRTETISSGKRYTFYRKGVPVTLRIQFRDENNEHRKNLKYVLEIETRCKRKQMKVSGQTDNKGLLLEAIPPNTIGGKIVLDPEKNEREFPFQLGHIDPIDEGFRGVQSVLNNLGYPCKIEEDKFDDSVRRAVKSFEQDNNLELTNNEAQEINPKTLKALQKAYSGK